MPEAQRGPITGLWSHSWPAAELPSNPRQPELGVGAERTYHLQVPSGSRTEGPDKAG